MQKEGLVPHESTALVILKVITTVQQAPHCRRQAIQLYWKPYPQLSCTREVSTMDGA
jgi:hypothetical protein